MTLPMKLFSKPGPQLRRIFELSAPKLSRSVAIKSRSPCALSIMGPNVKNPRRNSTIELCCVSSCLLTRAETLIGQARQESAFIPTTLSIKGQLGKCLALRLRQAFLHRQFCHLGLSNHGQGVSAGSLAIGCQQKR